MAVYRSDQAQLTFITEAAAGAYPEGASSVTQSVALNGLSPATTVGPTVALVNTSGNLATDAVHTWKCTYTTNGVESVGSAASASLTITAGNHQVRVTPPIGPGLTATTVRKIYRNQNGGTSWHFVGQIANNTASQFVDDNISDANLTYVIPSTSQLTADTAPGTSSIAVDSNANFNVGDLIQIGPLVGNPPNITPGAVYTAALNNESEIRRVDYKDGTTGLALDVPTGFWHGDNTFVHVVTAIADVVNDQYIKLVPGVYETVDCPDPDMTIEARYFLGTQSKRNFFNAYKGQQTYTGSVPGFVMLDARALRYPIGKVTSTTTFVNTGGGGNPTFGAIIDQAAGTKKGDVHVTVSDALDGGVQVGTRLLFTGSTVAATTSTATSEIRKQVGATSETILQLDYPLQFAHADNEYVYAITTAAGGTTVQTNAVSPTALIDYTHAITETVDLDTVSWHVHMRDSGETAANDFDRRYYGGMIGGTTLTADEGGMLTMSWDGVNFQGMVHNQKLGDAGSIGGTVPFYSQMQKIDADSIDFPSNDPYYFSQGEVSIFGETIARVRNFSLSIANNEEPRYYIQRRHGRQRVPT